jgi:hypothetical protein
LAGCWAVGECRRQPIGSGVDAERGVRLRGRHRVDHGRRSHGHAGPNIRNGGYGLFHQSCVPTFSGATGVPRYTPVVQFTPETDYGQGLTEGVTDLNQGITQQLADGNNVVVYGYSEGTAVATQEMINLDALPADQQPNPADLQFVLVEDLNNPNGGFFERFPSIPSLSFPATPADSPYPTDIYTIEYSGAADFPQYPSNIVADLNAAAGYVDLHPFLLSDYPTTFNLSELAGAVLEPTSPGYDGATEYFLIPTQDLPLLDGLRGIPGVGPAMADLIQPDLRVMVDMGYDWTGYANVDTPAEYSSPAVDPSTISALLALGEQQGMTAAMVDLGLLPQSDLPDVYPYVRMCRDWSQACWTRRFRRRPTRRCPAHH